MTTALLGALLAGCASKVRSADDAAPDRSVPNDLPDASLDLPDAAADRWVPNDLPDATADRGVPNDLPDAAEVGSDVADLDRPRPCGEALAACCAAPAAPCGDGLVCFEGRCEACAAGTTACGGSCHALASDRDHCGACGRACPAGEVCTAGSCRADCAQGSVRCPGDATCATDLASSPRHCGACGRACAAPAGAQARCVAGACATTACAASDCDGDPANGAETDTPRDACNCGACGRACENLRGVATARCVACACEVTACDEGYADCDGESANGCEVYTFGDPLHCGGCGRACPGGDECVEGRCAVRHGLTRCGPRLANLRNDRDHCGACGQRCPAAQVCELGRCVDRCSEGLDECGRETCIPLEYSTLHCGRCGERCAVGLICIAGRCSVSCSLGLTNCFGGCRDLDTDISNCGACGRRCPPGAFCRRGACHTARCRDGRPIP